MSSIKKIQDDRKADGKHFDFYRCRECKRIFTREEELEFYAWAELLSPEEEREATICPCGSMKFKPARPPASAWSMLKKDYRRWRIWSYVGKLILARAVAPWLEKKPNLRFLLRYIEKLV